VEAISHPTANKQLSILVICSIPLPRIYRNLLNPLSASAGGIYKMYIIDYIQK
jgi:hypothetical protein